jgi:hypothetical protein
LVREKLLDRLGIYHGPEIVHLSTFEPRLQGPQSLSSRTRWPVDAIEVASAVQAASATTTPRVRSDDLPPREKIVTCICGSWVNHHTPNTNLNIASISARFPLLMLRWPLMQAMFELWMPRPQYSAGCNASSG